MGSDYLKFIKTAVAKLKQIFYVLLHKYYDAEAPKNDGYY